MKISLSSGMKEKISFKELMSRLGLHIAYTMITTAMGGIMALNTDSPKAIVAFILLILANGIGVITAFIDQSASKFEGEIFKSKNINE